MNLKKKTEGRKKAKKVRRESGPFFVRENNGSKY